MILEVDENGGIVKMTEPQQYNDYHFEEPLENNRVNDISVITTGSGHGAVVDATFFFNSSISVIKGGKKLSSLLSSGF